MKRVSGRDRPAIEGTTTVILNGRWCKSARRPVSRVLSLPVKAGDGHSSGTPVAERLVRPTRATARKHAWARRPVPPLFGLAPGGVYRRRRRCRKRGALLPHPFTLTRNPEGVRAVCFLWHCPWGRPRRVLPGTVSPWSPDFPHPAEAKRGHPAVWHSVT